MLFVGNDTYVTEHTFTTDFRITKPVIDLTECIPEEIVLEYNAQGYTDEYIASKIMENMVSGVKFVSVGYFHKLDEASGEWKPYNRNLQPTNGDLVPGKYKSQPITLCATEGDNYNLKYNDTINSQIGITVYFVVSDPS